MSDRLQELNRLIAEERAGYTELITLLEQEQRELISGTAHKLEALAQQKAIVLQELDALAQQRGDHMRVLGMVSVNAWRAWLADKPELLPAWLGLEVLAQKAKLINEINGKLILTTWSRWKPRWKCCSPVIRAPLPIAVTVVRARH